MCFLRTSEKSPAALGEKCWDKDSSLCGAECWTLGLRVWTQNGGIKVAQMPSTGHIIMLVVLITIMIPTMIFVIVQELNL